LSRNLYFIAQYSQNLRKLLLYLFDGHRTCNNESELSNYLGNIYGLYLPSCSPPHIPHGPVEGGIGDGKPAPAITVEVNLRRVTVRAVCDDSMGIAAGTGSSGGAVRDGSTSSSDIAKPAARGFVGM
jgi:hypothetical protein